MTLNKLETGASKVNLTTDLRNVIHQINPNDLLCAYKPTFEKWATRTLQDLETPTEEDSKRAFGGSHICSQDLGQGDDKTSIGWGVCPLPHSGAGTTYQRELPTSLKLTNNKRTQSSSTIDKQLEPRQVTTTDKSHKVSSGLYPGRTAFQDYRIRDFGEERGFSSSYNRSFSPRHVPFKHSDCNAQHMENYRETYTYKKIGSHKNQYMKRALASGLTLQHYPFRCCDNHCCPGLSRSGLTQKDQGISSGVQISSMIKATPRSPQIQSDVVVTERKQTMRVANGTRLGLSHLPRREVTRSPVSHKTLTGLNSMSTMETYTSNLPSCASTKRDINNVLLDVPLMVCRTNPSLHTKKSQEKMYQLTSSNSPVMPSLVGSDSNATKKK